MSIDLTFVYQIKRVSHDKHLSKLARRRRIRLMIEHASQKHIEEAIVYHRNLRTNLRTLYRRRQHSAEVKGLQLRQYRKFTAHMGNANSGRTNLSYAEFKRILGDTNTKLGYRAIARYKHQARNSHQPLSPDIKRDIASFKRQHPRKLSSKSPTHKALKRKNKVRSRPRSLFNKEKNSAKEKRMFTSGLER